MKPPVGIGFHRPCAAFADLITAYYVITVNDPAIVAEDLLHPEWANIRFCLGSGWSVPDGQGGFVPAPDALLFGPTSRARPVRCGGGRIVGIGLTPIGWARIVGGQAAEFAEQITDPRAGHGDHVDDLLAGLADAQGEAEMVPLLDAYVGRVVRPLPAASALTRAAHRALLDPAIETVEAFAEAVGVTRRQLSTLCRRDFGFAPKLLLRRQRFLRTLGTMRERPDQPWATLVDDAYVDQSHFIREFRRFMGMTPKAYFAMPRLMLRPAQAARDRALGAPLQGLHEG